MRTRHLDRTALWLGPGAHPAPQGIDVPHAASLLEAVSYVAGERWTDRPQCVSPLLTGYGNMINDAMDPCTRQRLIEFIPWLIGTGTDRVVSELGDRRRTWVCARVVMRRWVPEYLEDRGLEVLADEVREIAEITDARTAAQARDRLRSLRVAAYAAGHSTGLCLEYAYRVAAHLVMEGIDSARGYRRIGESTAEAYVASHPATSWDGAVLHFEELLSLRPTPRAACKSVH